MSNSLPPKGEFSVRQVFISNRDNLKEIHNPAGSRYAAVSRVGKFLYVTGRVRKRFQDTRDLYSVMAILDMRLQRWRWVETAGCSIASGSAMFLYDDALYMYGTTDWQGKQNGNVSRFDLSVEEWDTCNPTSRGRWRGPGFTADFVERRKRLVVFGGRMSNRDFNHVTMFAMPEKRWVKSVVKGRPPSGRRNHGSYVERDTIYC